MCLDSLISKDILKLILASITHTMLQIPKWLCNCYVGLIYVIAAHALLHSVDNDFKIVFLCPVKYFVF